MTVAEYFSEFFSHIVWPWSIVAVAYVLIGNQHVKTLTNKYL